MEIVHWKCRKFGISLNLEKCVSMVFFGMIMGLIMSKEGKVLNPKKIQAIVNMLILSNPQ
jgi:hypothetical protein